MSKCNRKLIQEQFDCSPTTNCNPRTWYFNPRTPIPRTFPANPRREKFSTLCAARFVLWLMKFYGTPLLYVFLSGYTYFASIILNYISIWNEIGLGATWVEETLFNVLDLLDFYKKGYFFISPPNAPCNSGIQCKKYNMLILSTTQCVYATTIQFIASKSSLGYQIGFCYCLLNQYGISQLLFYIIAFQSSQILQ